MNRYGNIGEDIARKEEIPGKEGISRMVARITRGKGLNGGNRRIKAKEAAGLFLLLLVFVLAVAPMGETKVHASAANEDVQEAANGVVMIAIGVTVNDVYQGFYQMGSGFLIGIDGDAQYCLTNYHVVHSLSEDWVRENLGLTETDKIVLSIEVVILGDVTITAVEINGSLESDFTILELSQSIGNRSTLVLGDSDDYGTTQSCWALGFPGMISDLQVSSSYTSEDVTVTKGTILKTSSVTLVSTPVECFTHDAIIQEGNSGGPLVDDNGYVIGINTAMSEDESGNNAYYFAAKINMVRQVLDALEIPYETSDSVLDVQEEVSLNGSGDDGTAADSTAADSTAADSTAADSTAADSTAADSTAADSTAAAVAAGSSGSDVDDGSAAEDGTYDTENDTAAAKGTASAADETVSEEEGVLGESNLDGDGTNPGGGTDGVPMKGILIAAILAVAVIGTVLLIVALKKRKQTAADSRNTESSKPDMGTSDGSQPSGSYMPGPKQYAPASGTYTQACGPYAQSSGSYAQTCGPFSQAYGSYAQADGSHIQTSGPCAQADGSYTQPSGPYASAYGQSSAPAWQSPDGGMEETGVLGSDTGETTLLTGASGLPRAWLVRRKNNQRVIVSRQVFRIGKDRKRVDYCISDNSNVSRTHADIIYKGGGFYILDHNATNGTYVNGVQLPAGQERRLQKGDLVRLADEEFIFFL